MSIKNIIVIWIISLCVLLLISLFASSEIMISAAFYFYMFMGGGSLLFYGYLNLDKIVRYLNKNYKDKHKDLKYTIYNIPNNDFNDDVLKKMRFESKRLSKIIIVFFITLPIIYLVCSVIADKINATH